MALTVFLSCSFGDKDEDVVRFFRNILEERGFKVQTAQKENSCTVEGKIYPKIDNADIIVGLFSSRYKTDSGCLPPSAILFELGYARGKSKSIYAFREKGISPDDLGLLQFDGGNFPEFEIKKLEDKRSEFKTFIESWPEFEQKEIRGVWEFQSYVKDVTIYQNGYGVVRFRCCVRTKSEKFRKIPHLFGLGESAVADLKLEPFEDLRNGGPGSRHKNEQFFSFRVIDANFDESRVSVIPGKKAKANGEHIDFIIEFPSMPARTSFTYEWAWGAPGLFPVEKGDLDPGKRKVDLNYVCSTLPAIVGEFQQFIFVLRFEGEPEFSQIPIIKIFDSTHDQTAEKEFEEQRSALYTNYVSRHKLSSLYGGSIEAHWIPK